MATERKPYERRLKGKLIGWYVLWEGRQTWLGRFEKEAYDNWERLRAGKPVIRPDRVTAPKAEEPTVQKIVGIFLDYQKAHGSERTYRWYRQFLKSFCKHEGIGRLRVFALKKHMVQHWIDTNKTKAPDPKKRIKPWNENTAHNAARAVVACFNYAVEWEHLEKSPIPKLKKAKATPREDCELSPEEWKRLIQGIKDPSFKDAVLFMRLTGARPMECRNAEKRHFDPTIPAIVFPKAEAKGKKRERVIHLSGEALLIVQKLILRHPEGKLFRSGLGTPWLKDSLNRRFARLRKKLKIPHLIPYSLRHTYATDCVIKGIDSIVLAKLMGHTSTRMLEQVYAKHERRKDFMAQAAAKAIEGIG
jgi:integrase